MNLTVMNKDIVNKNHKGQLHGYQERYSDTYCDNIFFRGCFSYGIFNGYIELYLADANPVVLYYIV